MIHSAREKGYWKSVNGGKICYFSVLMIHNTRIVNLSNEISVLGPELQKGRTIEAGYGVWSCPYLDRKKVPCPPLYNEKGRNEEDGIFHGKKRRDCNGRLSLSNFDNNGG